MTKPTLKELNAARRLINRYAPNLYGELPATILRYFPGATKRWLEAQERQDQRDQDKEKGI